MPTTHKPPLIPGALAFYGEYMTIPVIRAPWTKEQIEHLNKYQVNINYHPYTCGNDKSNEAHQAYAKMMGDIQLGVLVATEKGWICPACDYKQDWALKWSLSDEYN